tara:strand:+ start:287 stop:463 length:177 start_codon:yes stop_codon:yes gene_type:complete
MPEQDNNLEEAMSKLNDTLTSLEVELDIENEQDLNTSKKTPINNESSNWDYDTYGHGA